ncbi:hypothetical protein DFH06DRAFT_1402575 [Mycena polygramma]|nr:hypothetical protein DFH06DRAFT_1402575 [Mycena polygramma]
MHSASPPGLSPTEFNVHLPCDEALWHASSATAWFAAAHTPSPYGVGIQKVYGVNMQHALAALAVFRYRLSHSQLRPLPSPTFSYSTLAAMLPAPQA